MILMVHFLDTLKMNMYPLMKIIKEETGEDWTFEQVLKFAAYPGMKVMEELGVKDQEKTYARWVQYVNDYEDGATLFEGFEEVLETFKNKKSDMANIVKLTGCKEVSHDIYAYFTCDAEKALKALAEKCIVRMQKRFRERIKK